MSPPVLGGVPYLLTVIVAKDAPWRDAVTKAILDQEAAGLVRYKFKPDTDNLMAMFSEVEVKYDSEKETITFKLENMIPIGLLMGCFLIIASFIFLSELIFPKFLRFSRKLSLCFIEKLFCTD